MVGMVAILVGYEWIDLNIKVGWRLTRNLILMSSRFGSSSHHQYAIMRPWVASGVMPSTKSYRSQKRKK